MTTKKTTDAEVEQSLVLADEKVKTENTKGSKKAAEETKAAQQVAKEKELATQKIYIGPGRPGLITNTVYIDGYPLPVEEMIEECPEIEKLMVKIADYNAARKKVKQKGTLEYANAGKVLEFFRKGDRKQ